MKAFEIRELNIDEVIQHLRDLEEELFNLKFRPVTKRLDNPLRLRIVRREIARVKTIINEHKFVTQNLKETGSENDSVKKES